MASTDPEKRRPGRPKGTKNKPTAGAVGRPPKGGGPLQKNINKGLSESTSRLRQTTLPFINTKHATTVPDPISHEVSTQTVPSGSSIGGESGEDTENASLALRRQKVRLLLPPPPPPSLLDEALATTRCATALDTTQHSTLSTIASAMVEPERTPMQPLEPSESAAASMHSDHAEAVSPRNSTCSEDRPHIYGPSIQGPPAAHSIAAGCEPIAGRNSITGRDEQRQRVPDVTNPQIASCSPSPPPDDGEDILEDEDDLDEDEFCPVPDDDEVLPDLAARAVGPSEPPIQGGSGAAMGQNGRGKPPCARSASPVWLKDVYADVRERLIAETKSSPSRWPHCYDRGDFTIGGPIKYHQAIGKLISPKDFFNPFFFIWLPHLLVPGGILCPACLANRRTRKSNGQPVTLQLNGWPAAPRRVVDMEYSIYIVGQRYRCGHDKCKKTYQCWSPAIISVLPPALATHFTHFLTFRGGLSDRLVAMLRASFRNGVGPSAFADTIRSFHYRYHEQLHVQYLEHVRERMPGVRGGLLGNQKYAPFGEFDNRSGYAGYVPGRNYFQLFYNTLIQAHAGDMDQHMAMLSAKYLAVDHSHKWSKRLAKVAGATIFGALHTTVNEYTEIRQMTLTPTKAHDQFMPSLQKISGSLKMYGHGPVELVFTDNVRADKAELELSFPSLTRDVQPVPNHSSLPPLVIPEEGWTVWLLSSDYQVRQRVNCILDDLAKLEDGQELFVGLTWSGQSTVRMLYPFLKNDRLELPHALLTLLRSRRIRKIGVGVKGDLTRLFQDCKSHSPHDLPFVGELELGTLAKSRNACEHANIGLADLVVKLLRCHLEKDSAIRVSTQWSQPILPKTHECYAALDVYACWRIYQVLALAPEVGRPVTVETPEGTAVNLIARDGSQVVARGRVLADSPSMYLGVNVSKTRVLVKVTQIEVPGYLVPADLLSTKKATSLSMLAASSHGPPPFILLYTFRHLRTTTLADTEPKVPVPAVPGPSLAYSALSSQPAALPAPETLEPDDATESGWYEDITYDPAVEQTISLAESDEAGLARAACLRKSAQHVTLPDERLAILSRVLGDPQ